MSLNVDGKRSASVHTFRLAWFDESLPVDENNESPS